MDTWARMDRGWAVDFGKRCSEWTSTPVLVTRFSVAHAQDLAGSFLVSHPSEGFAGIAIFGQGFVVRP